tara:strand:+ start:50 stop:613 length:564 start_codon:yes stop_codon:yes gene_type:complete
MEVKKILILGSTYLTELVVDKIKHKYKLVGYVPSINPTRGGNIDLPQVDINTDCDIKLSIQYDKIVKNTDNCFNVHTGLLPEYGGTNILDYTIKNKEIEQGLTFHKMTKDLDFGPIISKITYPVFKEDTAFNLYKRVLTVGPSFVEASLKLLEEIPTDNINKCYKSKPTIYKRGEFKTDKRIKNYDR